MLPGHIKSYYLLKPFLPRSLQLAMRRAHAKLKLRTRGDIWPIDRTTATPPRHWKGWPDGKRFALILTHDVESAQGQERVRELAELEQSLGFVASYNFVPEKYRVDEELKGYLTASGFEIGVHGLYHDGKYYDSYRIFQERARKINRYLKEWGSVGFRSPSMLHDLNWLRELDISYDSSTFDVDPFEPQPDGVGTIFPFWVSASGPREGYVELPYTLPQDFTLFVLLRQRNIDLWKKKLDWIVSKGGMALMLTHPDYISGRNNINGPEQYHKMLYAEFLNYIKKTYMGEYYHVLPRHLAEFWKVHYRNNERG